MQYLKQYGERLVELGYRIVPLPPGSKGPKRKGWPQMHADAAQVRQWYSNGSANDGIGVLARYTPAIDVDILDPTAAQEMSDLIDEIFPGETLMMRVGRAPKFLIPFRSDDPFKKLTSNVYTDGTNDHKVEILGDGQQWVAYHVHPETGLPYTWFDGLGAEKGICGLERDSLPQLARVDAQRVIDAFEVLAGRMVESGRWSKKGEAAARDDRPAPGNDDPFAAHAEPLKNLPLASVKWLMNKYAVDDHRQWVSVGMMLHHQFEASDEGFALWDEWSQGSGKYDAEETPKRWESFGHRNDAPTTFKSAIDLFGQPPAPEKTLEGNEFQQAALFASEQKVEWLVKKVLPRNALTIIYGEPGSGKSFFALDLVAQVARGLTWRGQRTRQCSVAYIAAEGVAGFGNRLKAYGEGHGVDLASLPVYVRGGQFTIMDQAVAVVDAISKLPDIGVVVIDTLAAVTPGANENTSEDMGAAIERANFITQTTGAAVILIHHTTKDGGSLRGWSGLLGAADSTIKIERKEEKRTAYIEKMKEGEDSGKYPFELRVVDLGQDEDGDPITSCVIEESEEVAEKAGARERKPRSGDFETSKNYEKARHFLRVIQDMCGMETGVSLQEDEVIEAIQKDETVNPMAEPDYPLKKNIVPTLRTLCQVGKISKEGRNIRLC
jgi:hypothetical protein